MTSESKFFSRVDDVFGSAERRAAEQRAADPTEVAADAAAQPTPAEQRELAELLAAEEAAGAGLSAAQADFEVCRQRAYRLVERHSRLDEFGGIVFDRQQDATAAKVLMYDAAEVVKQAEAAMVLARSRRNAFELLLSDLAAQRRLAFERKGARR